MPVTIDARGLACPQPVIRTRNVMREQDEVITLVSTRDQVGNVQRLGEKAGWRVWVEEQAGTLAVHMVKPAAAPEPAPATIPAPAASSTASHKVVVLSSDRMGRGEDDLGLILMRSFLYSLGEVTPHPSTLVLFNTGVKLATEGSPVIEELAALQAAGVEILVCGTCLGYFDLKERLLVGAISNMYAIAETLLAAGSSITI